MPMQIESHFTLKYHVDDALFDGTTAEIKLDAEGDDNMYSESKTFDENTSRRPLQLFNIVCTRARYSAEVADQVFDVVKCKKKVY
jgi:hypothetical protein